jgi:hypothetical protein
MAFTRDNFHCMKSLSSGVQLWTYLTDDAVGVFSAAGYFPYDAGVRPGDHIFISLYADVTDKAAGATGAYHLVVSTSTAAANARANIDVDVTVA